MPGIKSTRPPGKAVISYDVWDDGARNLIVHEKKGWCGNRELPLYPLQFSDVSRRDKRWFKHVNYPFFAVEMILTGAAKYSCDERCKIVTPGTVYLLTPSSCVRMVNSGDLMRRKLALLIGGSCIVSVAAALGFHSDMVFRPAAPKEFERRVRAVGKLMDRECDGIAAAGAVYELLLFLAHERGDSTMPENLCQVIDAIERNFTKPLKVKDLAITAGYSTATLRRKFAEHLRLTPLEYLMRFRLRHAIILLKEKRPVKEVAVACGFREVSRFIVAFKKIHGVTPGIYAAKVKNVVE